MTKRRIGNNLAEQSVNDAPAHEGDAIIKRSVLLAGHRTSVSLEAAFWDELKHIAASRNLSMNQLIAEVDATHRGNLSSALRLYVLKKTKAV